MRLFPKNKKGFTLIEILVVVTIIGVLAAIIFVSLDKAQAKSRDSRRAADLSAIESATRLYFLDTKTLPVNVNGTSGCQPGQTYSGAVCLNELVTGGYMTALPVDPINDSSHNYWYFHYSTPGNTYDTVTLGTDMENPVRFGPFPYGWKCSADPIKNTGKAVGSFTDFQYCVGFEVK